MYLFLLLLMSYCCRVVLPRSNQLRYFEGRSTCDWILFGSYSKVSRYSR